MFSFCTRLLEKVSSVIGDANTECKALKQLYSTFVCTLARMFSSILQEAQEDFPLACADDKEASTGLQQSKGLSIRSRNIATSCVRNENIVVPLWQVAWVLWCGGMFHSYVPHRTKLYDFQVLKMIMIVHLAIRLPRVRMWTNIWIKSEKEILPQCDSSILNQFRRLSAPIFLNLIQLHCISSNLTLLMPHFYLYIALE